MIDFKDIVKKKNLFKRKDKIKKDKFSCSVLWDKSIQFNIYEV